MPDRRLDVLFVNPNSARQSYQGLSNDFSAIEVPVWSLLLAEACRSRGFGAAILDCDAERLSPGEAIEKIRDMDPRLVCFVVYGQNPNSGTANMAGAVGLLAKLNEEYPEYKVCFVGSHTQALPLEILGVEGVDFVLTNEGVWPLQALLGVLGKKEGEMGKVNGIGWKERDGTPHLNPPDSGVPPKWLGEAYPGYAWDLLPMNRKPLDLYRAHNWFPYFGSPDRSPYAALYTSLGCPFKCDFCMINSINRDSNSPDWSAADSSKIRYWPWRSTCAQLDKLIKMGVSTIRLSDEMFFLNRNYYQVLLEQIRDRWGDFLNLWAYARVDTVRPDQLKLFCSAGVRWLALGIESASQRIRREVGKGGSYEEVDIRRVVKEIREAGINVVANYIFGLPDDDYGSMQETLNLSVELNTEHWNGYPAMALPGSPLYKVARERGTPLPDSFEGYGFLSYECLPLPTKHLTAAEVLSFRDRAFQTYFNRPDYLSMIEGKFGAAARENVRAMASIKLKRKILGDM